MKNHGRWFLARQQLESRLRGKRSNSKLPALIDLVMSRPVVSTGMIAKSIGVTPRAVQEMIDAHGLRETTGRGAIPRLGCVVETCLDNARPRRARLHNLMVPKQLAHLTEVYPHDRARPQAFQ